MKLGEHLQNGGDLSSGGKFSTSRKIEKFNNFQSPTWMNSDELTSQNKSFRQRSFAMGIDFPDVVFAYADVMQKKSPGGELQLLKANEMLQPDHMYEKIIQQIRQAQLDLTVQRTPLNYKKLQEILV